jgi:hypothetical protein
MLVSKIQTNAGAQIEEPDINTHLKVENSTSESTFNHIKTAVN